MMDYRAGIEMVGDRSDLRFILANKGANPLIVLGLNPSTADDREPDPTMRAVMRLAGHNGYDSFAMVNLYPVRTPDPRLLPRDFDPALHQSNLDHIRDLLGRVPCPNILLAYGRNVALRGYLKDCRNDIIAAMQQQPGSRFFVIARNRDGSPKHPLYAATVPFQEIVPAALTALLQK